MSGPPTSGLADSWRPAVEQIEANAGNRCDLQIHPAVRGVRDMRIAIECAVLRISGTFDDDRAVMWRAGWNLPAPSRPPAISMLEAPRLGASRRRGFRIRVSIAVAATRMAVPNHICIAIPHHSRVAERETTARRPADREVKSSKAASAHPNCRSAECRHCLGSERGMGSAKQVQARPRLPALPVISSRRCRTTPFPQRQYPLLHAPSPA
jgi:hypothetical protein